MDDLMAHKWHAMWDVLGTEDKWDTYDSWVGNWTYTAKSAHGKGYQIRRLTNDGAAISQWVSSTGPTPPAGTALPSADLSRAFLVEVYYPGACCTNTDWEVYLIAPDHSDVWYVWSLR